MLRDQLPSSVSSLLVVGPPMTEAQAGMTSLAEISEDEERIHLYTLPARASKDPRYWLTELVPALGELFGHVREAKVVHSGTSPRISRPFEISSLLFGRLLNKTIVGVQDIDQRRQAELMYRSGNWSLSSSLKCRLVHDPIREAQKRVAARISTLMLMKGARMVRDYRGPNVREFLDAAHGEAHIISDAALEVKLTTLRDPDGPLELVYFGRLTAYKGVDRCLRAVKRALRFGAGPIRFRIIGSGPEAAALAVLARELGIEHLVEFTGAVSFGSDLFERLYRGHLMLAAPLSEDTPRSALDAMAAGLPLLAYDLEYYDTLAKRSGAVITVPWDCVDALARRVAEASRDKTTLEPLVASAVSFARSNTQSIWLKRRLAWTFDQPDAWSNA